MEGTEATPITRFDFRAPHKIPPGFIREMLELHDTFARITADALTRLLKVPVTVDVIGAEQVSYDAYVRSMPNPNLITLVALDPLPGSVVLELSPQLGLILVDRMLGGPGRPVAPRRPTPLEESLLATVVDHPIAALAETFAGVVDVEPRRIGTELNPLFANAAPPTETVLTFTFSVLIESNAATARGLVGVGYPMAVLEPIDEAIRAAKWSETRAERDATDDMQAILAEAPVEVVLHTRPTALKASDLWDLAPGDVIGLDHRADEAFLMSVEGTPLIAAELGRCGPNLAARIGAWR